MDLDERDSELQSIGDAQLLKYLPTKTDAEASGLVASFSTCDGKFTKALFDYISANPEFVFEFHHQGVIIRSILTDNETGQYDTISYMIFNGKKQLEYTFCPRNIPGRNGTEKTTEEEFICIKVNSSSVLSYVKKNKATTLVRFEFNINNPRMNIQVINGGIISPFFLEYKIVPKLPLPIPGQITNPSTESNFTMTTELFSTAMVNMSSKYSGVLYDFGISVFNNGIYIWTDAPGVGGISHGKQSGTPISFQLKNSVAKRLAKLCKISPRSPVTITALDSSIFKLCSNIGSCEITIYQFPKCGGQYINGSYPGVTNAIQTNLQQQIPPHQQMNSGYQQQYQVQPPLPPNQQQMQIPSGYQQNLMQGKLIIPHTNITGQLPNPVTVQFPLINLKQNNNTPVNKITDSLASVKLEITG